MKFLPLKDKRLLLYKDAQLPSSLVIASKGSWQVVRWKFGNLLELTALNLPVPSPMDEYTWPIQPGKQPFPSQKKVASFMVLNPRSFVLSDTRTGKSRAALWAMDYLMTHANKRVRAIIVSDINALQETWLPEIRLNFMGKRTCIILQGAAIQRERKLQEDYDFYLINHDALRIGYNRVPARRTSLAKAFTKRDDIEIVCFDEATSYRNRTSIMSRAASDLFSKKCKYIWAMTGTPTPNGALDAYGIKKLVHPDFDMSFATWRDTVTYPITQFKRNEKANAIELTHKLLSPAIRITQDECFDVPDIEVTDCNVEMTDEQRRHFKELRKKLTIILDSGVAIDAVNQASLRIKLVQISCGVVYDSAHNMHYIDAEPRLKTYQDLLKKLTGKVITFTPFVSTVHMLHENNKDASVKIGNSLSRKERSAIIQDFIAGSKKTIISHPGPIARGIDLTCASNVVWYAPIERTEHYVQGNERINGINQKRKRYICRMACCDIERGMYSTKDDKISLMNMVLKLKEMRL